MTEATQSNVIRIHPDRQPERCADCSTPLDAVYHPHHFQIQQNVVDDRKTYSRNLEAPFRNRGVIVAAIPLGGSAVFYAEKPTMRAAVRGTAYNWALGRTDGAKMRAKKLCARHVKIERVA